MITQIEQAIVERLKQGLGSLVRTVKSYNGEADDLGGQIHSLPAVWVTYGGSKIEPKSTGNKRYQDAGEFVVMVATRSVRNEVSGRQGGIDSREIGSNDLIYAVRRLLDGQGLGLSDSRGLTPKAIRPLANHVLVQQAAVSIFAIEYTLRWDSTGLEDGRYPEQTDDASQADHVFTKYKGTLSEAWPDFDGLDGVIFDHKSQATQPINLDLNKDEK